MPADVAISKGQPYGHNRRSESPPHAGHRRHRVYVAQLLPDLEQARVLRDALTDYLKRDDITDEQRDAAIALQLKLITDIRKKRNG